MSFVIDNEQCIDCRLCIAECPDGGIGISFNKDERGSYKIDESKCTECIEFNRKSKCAYVCPVDCIELKKPEADSALWDKWKNNKNNEQD